MKAIKVAGKVVGWVVGGYAILNTLAWAAIGAGYGLSELHNAFDDDRIQDHISYVFDRVIDDAASGWKWAAGVFKGLFEFIAEEIKDAF